ncbi:MAG: hypothetical protein ACI4F4_01165, partial [Lachnospiraceae bacterium]
MKESLGGCYIHKRIAIFMALIMVLTMLPMHTQQVYAESNEAKILIWSTYIVQTEIKKLYASGLKDFISKEEVAGYAGVDSISVESKVGTQDNPQHFSGTEDLSQYDLIIVLMPYEALTDTDVSVFKNYLDAGGRIVLQGERDGFARYENKVLSDFAGQLGVTFQITTKDDDTGNAIINKDSDIMGGKDLVGNELQYMAIGEITYSGDAQVIATTVSKQYPFIVDFPVQKGRITVMSDINWWHRRSNMLHTPAQLQSAQELWGKILSNSSKNMEDVKNGINPKHKHHYNYISQGNKILAYCDETQEASKCEYYGISNAIAVTLLADDAFYSGEAYSGVTVEGIDTYNEITKSNLDKSQVSFYQVETKGTTSGGIKLESAPKEKGHYYAAITNNGAQAVAAFSIEGLPYSITIQNGTTEIADSKATEGTIVTIKADTAPAGKVFDKWVVESGSITLADANSATTTFTMPASAVSVKATYTNAHTHSYGSEWKSDADNHWHECSCGAKSEEAAHTASDWLTDTAATATNDGTKYKKCTVCHRVLETGKIPATGVSTYIITTSAGENGTISPSGAVQVAAGGSQTFTMSPASGYVVDTLKVDGSQVAATTSYTFRDVNAAHTIEVTFKQESQTPGVTAPSITTQPANATVKEDETAVLTVEYKILDGANSSWKPNSDGSLSIRGSGAFAKFRNVKVDGNLVDRNNYTVTEGSTIITLKADYLNTLSAGAHTFEMIWTDGSARTAFTIATNSTNNGG